MKQIQLTQGRCALVDDDDFEWLNQWKWCVHKTKYNVYAERRLTLKESILKPKVRMHRIILGATKDVQVDHRNGIGIDNQRVNLRICTPAQNTYNSKAKGGLSNYKGVHLYRDGRTWVTKISCNGKSIHLGYHKIEENAALAYNKKARELFGEFARLNIL